MSPYQAIALSPVLAIFEVIRSGSSSSNEARKPAAKSRVSVTHSPREQCRFSSSPFGRGRYGRWAAQAFSAVTREGAENRKRDA